MQTSRKLLLTSIAFLVPMGAVALVWWLTDPSSADHFWRAHGATVLQYALPPVFALIGWTGQQLLSPRSQRSTPDQLMQAQQALARRGLEWWRGVPEPAWPGRLLRAGLRPLDVPWAVISWAGTAPAEGPASSRIADLATWLLDGTNARLIIRGEASSGKSVLARQVMAELLRRRSQDDPVPVFLSLSSWNPEQQTLHDWMKYRIGLAYPELDGEATYGPSAVSGLVDQGRVLPILDGLDALPPSYRQEVFRHGEVMSQAPLIITGRTDVVPVIDDFVVIEPGRVPSEESDRFLREITGRNVFDELKRQLGDSAGSSVDDEELRRVLSFPRIIYLASIVYEAPLEQHDLQFQSDVTVGLYERVEEFLLRNLIPALLPAGQSWSRTFPWYATRAPRWLKRLSLLDLRDLDNRRSAKARDALATLDAPRNITSPLAGTGLDDPSASRIAWWNLYRGIPFLRMFQAPLRGLGFGLLAFVGSTLILRYYPPGYGWSYDVMTTGGYGLLIFIAASVFGAEDTREPDVKLGNGDSRLAILRWTIRYYRPRLGRTVLAAFVGMCCFGILIGDRVAMETRHTRIEGVRTGLWDGLIQGALLLVLVHVIAGAPNAPRSVKISDYPRPERSGTRTFATALLLGAIFGLLWGAGAVFKDESGQVPALWPTLGTGLITGIDFALGSWLFRWSRNWFRPIFGSDLRSAARRNLAGAMVRPLILGATFAVSFGVTAPLHFVDNYVFSWFVVGLAFGSLDTEWPLYFAAISWLAVGKRALPVRLNRFLECCRVAGILRVIGQEYQIHDVGLLRSLQSGGKSLTADGIAVVSHVAERSEIPADLTAALMEDVQPPRPGQYQESGSQAGEVPTA